MERRAPRPSSRARSSGNPIQVTDAEYDAQYTLPDEDQLSSRRKGSPVTFANCYSDRARAEAYATLEFKNTYHLAYRDIPAILSAHVRGRKGLDFGCGTGRSTRFLRQLGFEVTGVDIAADMIRKARELDPSGDYRLVPSNDVPGEVPGDDLRSFPSGTYDLVLAAFTFDNTAVRLKVEQNQLIADVE